MPAKICTRCNSEPIAPKGLRYCSACRRKAISDGCEARQRRRREKKDPTFLAKRKRAWDAYAAKPEHQIKIKARSRIKHLVRTGRVTRLPCEQCGNPRTQAHHDDYSRPLDVRWLCSSCHAQLHHAKRA